MSSLVLFFIVQNIIEMKHNPIFLILLFLAQIGIAQNYPVVGHLQGFCKGVAKYENYAYFNAGSNIFIAKEAQTGNFEVVNQFYAGPGNTTDIQVHNDMLILAVYLQGIAVYDLADPENPEKLCLAIGGYPNAYRRSLFSNDTVLIGVAGDNNALFDISDPSQPQYLSNISFEFNGPDAVAVGENMFFGFSQEGYSGPHYLWAYDVSNPASPSVSASLQIAPNYMAPYADCMGYVEDMLFVSFNDTVKIYDVANPAEINYLTQFPVSANIRYFELKDGLMICAMSGSGVEIYDITDVFQPQLVSFYEKSLPIDYATLAGDYMMLAHNNYGCSIMGVEEDWEYDEVFMYDETDGVFGVKIQGNLGYFGMDILGYQIYDVFDALHPVRLGNIDTLKQIETIEVDSDIHYCSKAGGDDIYVVDVSDHWAPFVCSTIETSYFSKYQVENEKLFIREGWDVLTVYDVSNPEFPVFQDTLFIPGGHFFVNDSLLITYDSHNGGYLYLTAYYLSDVLEFELLSELEMGFSGYYTPHLIRMDENVIYVGIGSGMLTVEIDENGEMEYLDQLTWSTNNLFDFWLFLEDPNPFETQTMCISGNVDGTYYNFAVDVSDPENIFVYDTLPVSYSTMEPHNNLYYVTNSYAGYDLYGEYVVNIPEQTFAENDKREIRISPNPTSGQTTIIIPGNESGDYSVAVFDAKGALAFRPISFNGNSFTMDVSGIEPGVYFLRIEGKGVSKSARIIITE